MSKKYRSIHFTGEKVEVWRCPFVPSGYAGGEQVGEQGFTFRAVSLLSCAHPRKPGGETEVHGHAFLERLNNIRDLTEKEARLNKDVRTMEGVDSGYPMPDRK